MQTTYPDGNRITNNYDAAGNLVSDGTHAFFYDGFNRLIRVEEGQRLVGLARIEAIEDDEE